MRMEVVPHAADGKGWSDRSSLRRRGGAKLRKFLHF